MNKFIKEHMLKFFHDNNTEEQYQIVNSYVEFENSSFYIFSLIIALPLYFFTSFLTSFSLNLSQSLLFLFLGFIPFWGISMIPAWFINQYQKKNNYPIMNKFVSFVTKKKKALQYIRNQADLLKDLKTQYVIYYFFNMVGQSITNSQELSYFNNRKALFENAIKNDNYLDASRILFFLYPQIMGLSGLVGNSDATEQEKRNLYAEASVILEFLENDAKVNNLEIKEVEKEFNF